MVETLSTERVAEIRALAEKATPGPWEVEDEQNDGNFGGGPDCNSGYKSYAVVAGNKTVVDTLNSDLAEIEEDGDCEDGSWRYSRWDEVGRRNAAYIAALDPQTVLALLASHEALRAEVEAMRAQIEASQQRRLEIGDDIKDKLAQKLADAELTTARTDAAQRMRERCAEVADDEANGWKDILASAAKRAQSAALLSAVGYQGDPEAEVIEAQTGVNVATGLSATIRALPLEES